MARYGWEIYKANGQLLTDDTFFNCYFLDSGYLQVGSYKGNSASYSKTFPDYVGADVRVIIGTGPLQSGTEAGLSVTVDTVSGGVPRVRITETRGNSTGCGSTFWVIATRIPPTAPIADTYGIGLFDAAGGIAFTPEATPFKYLGTALQHSSNNYETPVGSDNGSSGALFYFETDDPEMPICFVTTKQYGQSMPKAAAVRPSTKAPVSKNYRWAVGIATSGGFGIGVAPAAELDNAVFHMFQPSRLDPYLGVGEYGIVLNDGGGPMDLAETDVLTLRDRAATASDFKAVGGDYRIYATGSGVQAMFPMPNFFKYLGVDSWLTVDWQFVIPGGAASNYWRIREYHGDGSAYGNNYTPTGNYPTWYRDRLINSGIQFNSIRLNQYV